MIDKTVYGEIAKIMKVASAEIVKTRTNRIGAEARRLSMRLSMKKAMKKINQIMCGTKARVPVMTAQLNKLLDTTALGRTTRRNKNVKH